MEALRLHDAIQKVTDLLLCARGDSPLEGDSQVATRLTVHAYRELSFQRQLLLKKIQNLSFMGRRNSMVVLDPLFVNHDSHGMSWTNHAPDDVTNHRDDNESNDEWKHRNTLDLRLVI
jgi:hypothetical protein